MQLPEASEAGIACLQGIISSTSDCTAVATPAAHMHGTKKQQEIQVCVQLDQGLNHQGGGGRGSEKS
jgi:hypothetical protein